MAQSIADYTDGKWDVAAVIVTVDKVQPTIYATGDIFTLSFDNDNVTITTDVYGHGITVIHHNGQATFTLNLTALDAVYQNILNGYNPTDAHVIDVMTPIEHLHIDSAFLPKLGPFNSGSDAPTRSLEFHTPHAIAEPA